ncbi:MAG: hypothetical protein ABSH47_10325 [Bryobacteraceae bacterium]|jgi:hypothetical protein
MLRPSLIHVGDRVLNLEAVRYIEIEGPHLVNVYITERKEPLQFTEQDARTLVEILNGGYVHPAIELNLADDQG